jgi:diguanylate cyclase (GGDEF)-like protein
MTNLTVTSLSRQVSALKQEIESLCHAAGHDPLTGLGNRRLLEERSHGRGGFFVAIDLNGFKRAQDAHPLGHAFGDLILREFAHFLLRNGWGGDRVACRVGGDEFVVWSPRLASAIRMRNIIHRWRAGAVTASAGVGATLAEADAAMYQSKEARR